MVVDAPNPPNVVLPPLKPKPVDGACVAPNPPNPLDAVCGVLLNPNAFVEDVGGAELNPNAGAADVAVGWVPNPIQIDNGKSIKKSISN